LDDGTGSVWFAAQELLDDMPSLSLGIGMTQYYSIAQQNSSNVEYHSNNQPTNQPCIVLGNHPSNQ
jgi:hypothetical protein